MTYEAQLSVYVRGSIRCEDLINIDADDLPEAEEYAERCARQWERIISTNEGRPLEDVHVEVDYVED